MADLVVVQVAKSVESLAHYKSSLRFSQVLPFRDEEEQLTTLAKPEAGTEQVRIRIDFAAIKLIIIFREFPYSVTRKQMRSVSQVSWSLMMFGWS